MSRLSTRLRAALTIGVPALLIVGLAIVGSVIQSSETKAAPKEGGDSDEQSADASQVTLPDFKAAEANIQTETINLGSITHSHSVPARVAYNDNHHIELKAPTSGVLISVNVKPGDLVEAGQTVAWLNSSEIGAARADVMKREADLALATTVHERQARINVNVDALNKALKQQTEYEPLKKQFAGRLLGDYRNELFAAYSRLLLAEFDVTNSVSMAKEGAIAGRVFQARQQEARAALAALNASIEQAEQDVLQAAAEAKASFMDAARRVEIAKQHVSSLMLDRDALAPVVESLADEQPTVNQDASKTTSLANLSRVAIRAPFAGTIEDRHFSARERVQLGDSLFILADTRSLWVTAEIRENDWPAMQLVSGHRVDVAIPALGDRRFDARVDFIGRKVSTDTNAIPIVAEIDNSSGNMRPGLFARVCLPIRSSSDVITVDARAVQQHDSESFVFVSLGDNKYRRTDVTLGDESNDRVEIKRGLNIGEKVVTHGAFILKSELLLEGEE